MEKETTKEIKHSIFDNENIPLVMLLFSTIFLYIIALSTSQDNDMFFEIMSGRDILKGNFHTVSHLNNHPMIIQQWLYCVFMALFDKLGYLGHMLFVLIQNIILYILSSLFIYRKTHNLKKATIGSFVSIVICYQYMVNIRPQIITVILLIAELLLIELYKEKDSILYLFCVIPILLLHANFHQAVFLYSLFVLIPYYIDKKEDKLKLDWRLILISPVYLLCSLCTPYGIDGSTYIIKTFTTKAYSYFNIVEIQPLSIFEYHGIILLIGIAISIWCIYNKKLNKFMLFYVFSLFLLVCGMNTRHLSILFLMFMYILSYDELDVIVKNKYVKIGLAFMFLLMSMSNANEIKDIRTTYIDNIGDYITEQNAPIYNVNVHLGNWLEYQGYNNVLIDTRTEAFPIMGDTEILPNIYALQTGIYKDLDKNTSEFVSDEYVLDTIKDYDYVVTLKLYYVNRVLGNNAKYKLIYKDNTFYIWEKVI